MSKFVALMKIKPMDRVLDLGGHPDIWAHVEIPLRLTILNLPGNVVRKEIGNHVCDFIEGDACDLGDKFDQRFDLVYSNSVIEHVGDEAKQLMFAEQVRKLDLPFWIQTPSKWFPIEAHCGMPFWWWYPESWRQWFIKKWRPKLPAWTEMVEETRVLEADYFSNLFPSSEMLVERFAGIPKSYVVWRPCD